MVSVTGAAETAGACARRVASGFVSEEAPDREEAGAARRAGVFGGVGATEAAAPAGSGKDGGPGGLCIFFRLSSSGFAQGAGRDAGEHAGTVVGWEKANDGCVVGGLSVAEELETALGLSSRTLLNHCSDAFFSMSRSSAVME